MCAKIASHVCARGRREAARDALGRRRPRLRARRPGTARSRRAHVGDVAECARTTSAIGVETTGRPAAKYSSVLVGEIDAVARLIANGISATLHAGQQRRQRGVRQASRESARSDGCGKHARIDLRQRADQQHVALGEALGERRDQLVVEPLVDDADIGADRAAGQRRQRVRRDVGREALELDAAGIAAHLRPVRAAPFVERRGRRRRRRRRARAARASRSRDPGRREIESAQVVHHVVDDRCRLEGVDQLVIIGV